MRNLFRFAAILSIITATPLHAAIFQYFEGNNCTQKRLGAADSENLKATSKDSLSWNLQGDAPTVVNIMRVFAPMALLSGPRTYNDEIRSVLVLSNWRTTREGRSPTFTVYDNPDGKTDDDWAKLYVSDASLIPDEGVCVGGFERPFNQSGIRLERHPNNGLDGKISRLRIDCDAGCRGNLTPDLRPVAATSPAPDKPRPRVIDTTRRSTRPVGDSYGSTGPTVPKPEPLGKRTVKPKSHAF